MRHWRIFSGFIIIGAIILFGCSKNPELPATSIPSSIPTATTTPSKTNTLPPTSTPTLTATPTPTEHPGWMPEGTVNRFGKGSLFDMVLSPDKQTVAIASTEGIYLVNASSGRVEDFLLTYYDPLNIAYSSDGQRIYIAIGEEGVRVYEHSTTGWTFYDKMPYTCANLIALSPDETTLLAACFKKNKKISLSSWDIATKKQLFELGYQTTYRTFPMIFSPTNSEIAAFARNNVLTIMNVRNGKVLQTYADPEQNMIYDVDYSPNGSLISLSTLSDKITLLNSDSLDVEADLHTTSKVYQISFIDNERMISINEGKIVMQDLRGTPLKTIEYYGSHDHVYSPDSNLVFVDRYFDVDAYSLDSRELVTQIHGFHPSYWQSASLNEDGNILLIATAYGSNNETVKHVSYANDADHFIQQDYSIYCEKPGFPSIVDKEGDFIFLRCTDSSQYYMINNHLSKIVRRWDIPISMNITDKFIDQNGDELKLAAMIYENDDESYIVEIWNMLTRIKLTEFVITDFNPDIKSPMASGFSPNGTYLTIKNKYGNSENIYSISTGEIFQSIPNTEYRIMYSDDESLVFIQADFSFTVYDFQTGSFLQRYYLQKNQTMQYIDKDKTFVTFSDRKGTNGSTIIDVNYYLIDSPNVYETKSITLPAATSDDDLAQTGYTFRCRVDSIHNGQYVIFLPQMDGENALMFTKCAASESDMKINKIFLVDLENESIIKDYTYIDFETFFHYYQVIGNYLYSRHDNNMFVWDISIE